MSFCLEKRGAGRACGLPVSVEGVGLISYCHAFFLQRFSVSVAGLQAPRVVCMSFDMSLRCHSDVIRLRVTME